MVFEAPQQCQEEEVLDFSVLCLNGSHPEWWDCNDPDWPEGQVRTPSGSVQAGIKKYKWRSIF